MHAEIIAFLQRARRESGLESLAGLSVVEFGSVVMHGSPREVFTGAASYVGVDWRPGPGVDVVALAHRAPVEAADVVVCCQMVEHDPHWERTVEKGCSLIREGGGWLFWTWAGPGYDPHELDTAPAWDGAGPYYANRSVEEVADVVRKHLPHAEIRISYDRGTLDALLWARVEGAP